MNRMTKTRMAAASLIVCGTLAFAFDYGAELTNSGGLRYIGETEWYTDHKSTFWVSIPLGTKGTESFAVEGSTYASKPAEETSFKFFADLDLFRLSLSPVSLPRYRLSLDAGRIPASDITGLVFNQTVDGIEFHSSVPAFNADFLAAYTGLLNIRKSGSLMTDDDYADADAAFDKAYVFGPARIIGKFTIQIPEALGYSDLILETLGQYDLRRYLDTDHVEIVDTVYATVSLSGPVLASLFYSVSGTVQAGILDSDDYYSETSALASFRLDLFPAAKHLLYMQMLFSPGDGDYFTGFLPISFQSAGTMYLGGYGNLFRVSGGWQYNPFAFLNADIAGKVFMHPVEPEEGDGLYDSTELSLGATIKATNDLRFRMDSAVLFPNGEDFVYQASLKAILDL